MKTFVKVWASIIIGLVGASIIAAIVEAKADEVYRKYHDDYAA